jgi:hypothetical protein
LSTRTFSIRQLHKLERLLLDADVNIDLEPLLRAIGFRTEFALRVGVNIRNDTDILRWARRHRYIMVCHDKFKDRQTRMELYPEIYHRGGKIIQIGGGPSQDCYTSLGKLLLHRQKWLEFFREHDGIVIVHEQGMHKRDANDLYTIVQRRMPLSDEPIKTLKSRKPIQHHVKRRLKEPPPEQARF